MLLESTQYTVYSHNAGLPILTPIAQTNEGVKTVAGLTNQGIDPLNRRYFIKGHSPEFNQLVQLQRMGVSVPDVITSSDGRFATLDGGKPLQAILEKGDSSKLLHVAGSILRDIHDRFSKILIPKNLPLATYKNTAHIPDCFFYKWEGLSPEITEEKYQAYKNGERTKGKAEVGLALPLHKDTRDDFIPEIPDASLSLQSLIRVANSIALGYLNKLTPYVKKYKLGKRTETYLTIPDEELFFGDYKPENLLVKKQRYNGWELRVIDPTISKGSKFFDLAKFTSRVLMEQALNGGKASLKPFFSGYGMFPDTALKVYGNLTFNDLVTMDQLNILKSYTKRHGKGEGYRFVDALSDERFCKRLTGQLVLLSQASSRESFDHIILGKGESR